MFGINFSIKDSGIYILDDSLDNQTQNLKTEIGSCSREEIDKLIQLKSQLNYFKSMQEDFKNDIANQLKNEFQFSCEELYAMYGQYDKFINIEFHKYSESALKYGRSLMGTIVYSKFEREELESIIRSKNVPRTRGVIKLRCSKLSKLSDEHKAEIENNGVPVGDIYEILTSDYFEPKSYNQDGIKEIPNTIKVEFDPTGIDPLQTTHWVLSKRVKDGNKLAIVEWEKYIGYSRYYNSDKDITKEYEEGGFDINEESSTQIRFYELEAKFLNRNITTAEKSEFGKFLNQRRANRTKAIERELKRSTSKTLQKFESEHPDIYSSLQESIIAFSPDSLAVYNVEIPIYWDYEGYLHIYLRHCEELNIEGHFEQKTKFQYQPKDIKRVLKICIESLTPQINVALKAGKQFRANGGKALYYNGNYYAIHILENGRVASFHPLDNHNK